MRLRALVALVVAAVLALAGCGSDAGLSSSARVRLGPLIEQVRHAAEAHDTPGALRALAAVQGAVAAGVTQGEISASRAAQILKAVAGVSSRLTLVATTVATTTTTTTTTTAPPDTRPRPGKHKGGDQKGD